MLRVARALPLWAEEHVGRGSGGDMGTDGRGLAQSDVRLYRIGRARPGDVEVALGRCRRAGLGDGGHGALQRPNGILGLGLVHAELRVVGLVSLVRRYLLAGRGLGARGADGARIFVGRVDGRVGERREVAAAVAELVLDGEGREATEAAARLVLLLEALREQAALEGEGIQRGEGGRRIAGARAGQVGAEGQIAHAGAGEVSEAEVVGGERVRGGGRFEGLGAEVEAARALVSVCHGEGTGRRASGSWNVRRKIDDAGPSCARPGKRSRRSRLEG